MHSWLWTSDCVTYLTATATSWPLKWQYNLYTVCFATNFDEHSDSTNESQAKRIRWQKLLLFFFLSQGKLCNLIQRISACFGVYTIWLTIYSITGTSVTTLCPQQLTAHSCEWNGISGQWVEGWWGGGFLPSHGWGVRIGNKRSSSPTPWPISFFSQWGD